MLLLTCPWCGPRAQSEFTYGGDANVQRPDPETATEQQWYEYVYIRDNPRGPHLEWWHHTGGCRHWVKVVRNTLTHEVLASGAPDADLSEAVDG